MVEVQLAVEADWMIIWVVAATEALSDLLLCIRLSLTQDCFYLLRHVR